MTPEPEAGRILTAVVTGHHPFDVPAFHALFRSFPDVDAYIQHMEDFASDFGAVRTRYDVVLFYNMHQETPAEGGPWYTAPMKEALEQLGTTEQGIFVLHHAILAFPNWSHWNELVGIPGRLFSYHIGETIQVDVADPDHPITRGLTSWEMVDETYAMESPGEGSHALLTVDHPRSMRTVAWTRAFGKARVFCLQLGHDANAFAHPSFRTVVQRGIRWCARRA